MRVLVGGPIKAGFSAAKFNSLLRNLVETTCSAVESLGAVVLSAHRHEQYSILPAGARAGVAGRDLGWMRAVDRYLALCPTDMNGVPVPSIGTGVEIGWASILSIPTVVLIDEKHSSAYSPFLTSLPACLDVRLADLEVVKDADLLGNLLQLSTRRALTEVEDGG